MKIKIKKGDTVEVISGIDKDKRGEVIRVMPDEGKVVVQGVNVRKKHQSQVNTGGRNLNPGIIEFEAPFAISNVMLVCPSCNKPTRVGFRRDEDGATRVCKHCGKDIG